MKSLKRYFYYQLFILLLFVITTFINEWWDLPHYFGDPPVGRLVRRHEIMIEFGFTCLLFSMETFLISRLVQNIKILQGLIPICVSCKKVRETGTWKPIEVFISEHHSLAEFSHSMCPECQSKCYPEFKERSGG